MTQPDGSDVRPDPESVSVSGTVGPPRGPAAAAGPAAAGIPGGEAIPAERRLARPPGDRFRRTAPPPVRERPDVGRAALLGVAGGLVYAVPAALLLAVLSITAGLVALAVLGGWLIGVGVRTGAWQGVAHLPSKAPLALAGVIGAVAWLAGMVLAWVTSIAILPASSMGFMERLVANPFPDWIAPQLAPLDYLVLTVLVAVAWVAAHTTALEREAARRSEQ